MWVYCSSSSKYIEYPAKIRHLYEESARCVLKMLIKGKWAYSHTAGSTWPVIVTYGVDAHHLWSWRQTPAVLTARSLQYIAGMPVCSWKRAVPAELIWSGGLLFRKQCGEPNSASSDTFWTNRPYGVGWHRRRLLRRCHHSSYWFLHGDWRR